MASTVTAAEPLSSPSLGERRGAESSWPGARRGHGRGCRGRRGGRRRRGGGRCDRGSDSGGSDRRDGRGRRDDLVVRRGALGEGDEELAARCVGRDVVERGGRLRSGGEHEHLGCGVLVARRGTDPRQLGAVGAALDGGEREQAADEIGHRELDREGAGHIRRQAAAGPLQHRVAGAVRCRRRRPALDGRRPGRRRRGPGPARSPSATRRTRARAGTPRSLPTRRARRQHWPRCARRPSPP